MNKTLMKKIQKKCQYASERYRNLFKEEKEKKFEYMKHYYCLAHKKYILSCLVDFQGPETIKFILGIIEMIYFFMFCPNEETFKFFFN